VATNRTNGRAAEERRLQLLAIAAIITLLLGLRIAIAIGGPVRSEPPAAGAPDASATDVLVAVGTLPPSTGDARSSAATPALEHPGAAPAAEPSADPAAAERTSLRRNLTSAVELSVAGALDPSAILRAGLSLLQLHLAKDDLPTTAPDGSLRYPLSGCPPGVRAELWISRTPATKDAKVLSLRVELDPPAEPYLLEGAVRNAPIVYVQAFLDADGRMKDLVLMTDISPSSESRKFDLPVLQGRVPQGVVFHADLSRPDEWKAESYGLDDGVDRTWSDPVALLGDPWPASQSSLAELGSGLLGLLSEARR